MRVVLIGGTGQLGADLVRTNPGLELIVPTRDQLDLARSPEACDFLQDARPDIVVNCAAFHDVPRCEIEPGSAFGINCVAVRDLARTCGRLNARFVTFSTDYVFDGAKMASYVEDDRPRPLQIYGTTRLAGEFAAMWEAPDLSLVIRTCGLYGVAGSVQKGGNFVDKRVDDARRLDRIEMGCDQTVSPTSTSDLSVAVWKLLAHPEAGPGIYHLVNEGACTWYELTREILSCIGSEVPVIPVDRGGRTGQMRRPLYSALQNTRARALGITLPPWRDALRRYLSSSVPGMPAGSERTRGTN